MKTCTKCGRTLALGEFGIDRRRRDGLNGWCRACIRDASRRQREAHPEAARAAAKAWRERHPDKVREQTRSSVLRRYGFTRADFNGLLARQGGGCAICGGRSGARSLHIDHNHVVGFNSLPPMEKRKHVRGLLCENCNRGLGHAKDDPELLEKAAAYLEAFQARRRAAS